MEAPPHAGPRRPNVQSTDFSTSGTFARKEKKNRKTQNMDGILRRDNGHTHAKKEVEYCTNNPAYPDQAWRALGLVLCVLLDARHRDGRNARGQTNAYLAERRDDQPTAVRLKHLEWDTY